MYRLCTFHHAPLRTALRKELAHIYPAGHSTDVSIGIYEAKEFMLSGEIVQIRRTWHGILIISYNDYRANHKEYIYAQNVQYEGREQEIADTLLYAVYNELMQRNIPAIVL